MFFSDWYDILSIPILGKKRKGQLSMNNVNTAIKKLGSAKLFKTILSLIVVLSLLVGCSLMFAGCKNTEDSNNDDKNNAAQYEGLEKEEYLQKLESNNLGSLIDSVGKVYGEILGGMKDSSAANAATGAKTDLTLTLGEDLRDMLEEAIFGGDIGDMDFLSKINLNVDASIKNQMEKVQMDVGLNGQKIITLNMLMNMADYIMYMAAPELNDGWIKFDMGDMMDGASTAGMMNSAAMMTALADALPDADTLTKVLNRYLNIVLPELDNVEQTTTTLEVNGVKQECTQLTLKIYEADALAIAKAVLTAAKDDADLKKIIEGVAKAMEDLAGEDIGADEAYTDFKEAVTDMLADLEDVDETDTENPIVLVTYVNKDHKIVGRMLKISTQDSDRGTVYYYNLTEGDKFVFETAIPSDVDDSDDFKISGTGTKKDGKTNGTFTIFVEGKDYVTLKLEDLTEESGTLTLEPTETMVYELGLNALPFKKLAVQIKLGGDGIELNVLSESKLLAGLALKVMESAGPDLSEPSNATDAMDSAAMQSWAEKLDLNKVLDNLEKAGVPSTLIDALENGGLFGGASSDTAQPAPDVSWEVA